MEAARVVSGVPDPQGFKKPLSYIERAPSEVFAEAERRASPAAQADAQTRSWDSRTNSVLDQAYRHAQTVDSR